MAKKPKGLSIKRNGANFVCSWNHGESGYDAQEFRYATKSVGGKWTKWIYINISKGSKSQTIKWNAGVSLDSIKFEVRAKNKKKWSGWADAKTFDVTSPSTPSCNVKISSTEYTDARVTFSWTVDAPSDKKNWFWRVGWQTRLVNNYGTAPKWSDVVYDTHSSGSATIQDDSKVVFAEGASYKREFRLVAFGPGGHTPSGGWEKAITKSHIYARPNTPSTPESTLTENGNGGYLCTVNWNSNQDGKHPLDSHEIQYTIVKPSIKVDQTDEESFLDIPTGQITWQVAGKFYPQKANQKFTYTTWKNASKYKTVGKKKKKKKRLKKTKFKKKTHSVTIKQDPSTTEELVFLIDQLLEPDEVVFVRAMSKRDFSTFDTPSHRDLCDDGGDIYKLSKPTEFVPSLSPIESNRIKVEANNTCQIDGSFLIVSFKAKDSEDIEDIGIIESKDNGEKLIEIPKDVTEYSIGIRAAVGIIPTPVRDETRNYNKYPNSDQSNIFIESDQVWVEGTTVPSPPSKPILSHTNTGNIHVHWDWDWKEAQSAELSWSDYQDAWVSTNEPSYYTIDSLYDGDWNISNLSLGETYYVKVRLKRQVGDAELVSKWSEPSSILLSSTPSTPGIEISPRFINPGQSFTVTWTYVSNDNTVQKRANVYLYDPETKKAIKPEIASVDTVQSVKIDTSNLGWEAGETKQIVVEVVSESDVVSELSPSTELRIIAPPTCSVTYSDREDGGLVSTNITTNAVDHETQEESLETIKIDKTLRSLPLTLNVTGSGEKGRTSVIIKRFDDFNQPGPDENEFHGYDEEIIFSASYIGEEPLIIQRPELDSRFSGSLDEGAAYTILASIEDEDGQIARNEDINFVVDWNHDAMMPQATMSYITNNDGEIGAKINIQNFLEYVVNGDTTETITHAISDADPDDVLDIYRLSVDKPELILRGGRFDTEYVDPYPTIGEFGGYRIVYRTKYDDFMMSDGAPAWLDISESNDDVAFEPFTSPYSIINFDGNELHLEYDVKLSNSWNKKFTETKYLGGSIQGDWTAGVSRTGSISVNVTTDDAETIRLMRRLAVFNGICQIRSYDGSNYKANVNVSENIDTKQLWNQNDKLVRIASYSLNITRVDGDFSDMMTLTRWNE